MYKLPLEFVYCLLLEMKQFITKKKKILIIFYNWTIHQNFSICKKTKKTEQR